MEDLAGEEVSEQLKFENLVPEEKKTPEIISTLPGEFQPRKVEELLPDANILPDTYIIYPTGGYHPFYGVLNTLSIYQQKIWPYVKRIKFEATEGRWKSKKTSPQINPIFKDEIYFRIGLTTTLYRTYAYRMKHRWGEKRDKRDFFIALHRLIALAYIPNPKNKPCVMHLNDDSTNYLIENLEWGTHSENNRGKINKRPDTMEQKYLNLVNKGIIKG